MKIAGVIVGGFLLVSLVFYSYKMKVSKENTKAETIATADNEIPSKTIKKEYSEILDSLNKERVKLAAQYKKAVSEDEKTKLVAKASHVFQTVLLDEIIPEWYGTPWEFYGTSETPNKGSIACGYFVTTVLRDAGVKIDRIHLAEIESETMIRTFISKDKITRYRNTEFDAFLQKIKSAGNALYVVGLDCHTGFLLCRDSNVYFLHSYVPGVLKEPAKNSYWLSISSYRVTGKISHDNTFIKKWLLGENFPNLAVKK